VSVFVEINVVVNKKMLVFSSGFSGLTYEQPVVIVRNYCARFVTYLLDKYH